MTFATTQRQPRRIVFGMILLLLPAAGDVAAAFEIYARFAGKAWSFTDCVSYVVIQRLGIKTAASFDQHFRQSGS